MDETVIGGYQLGKCLGTGATAVVHVGTRIEDGAKVALKVLHPDLVDNKELVERFRREARTLKNLSHDNIVGFIGFIEEPPNYVFVMELLSGGTLETYIKVKGKVREDRCATWCWQLAVALAEAHGQNVVHRDIKPANVFLTTEGRVVLSDFGLARPENDKVTRAGTKMMGTPLYMAPEQILGRTATPATDVYQVGLLLYEMMIGARAFPRQDPYTQMMARLDEDLFVPLDVEVPPLLREVVRRCGFRNPERRYPSGKELTLDLQAASQGTHLPWTPPAPGAKRKGTLTTQGLDWRDPQHYKGTMLVCPQINLRYDPDGKPFVVGSDPAVQVCLESRQEPIAPRQLRFSQNEGLWQVETGNFQAQVLINGQPLRAGTRGLTSGDILELGGYQLLWVDHQEPPPPSPAPESELTPRPQPQPAARAPAGPPAKQGCGALLLLGSLPFAGLFLALLLVGSG